MTLFYYHMPNEPSKSILYSKNRNMFVFIISLKLILKAWSVYTNDGEKIKSKEIKITRMKFLVMHLMINKQYMKNEDVFLNVSIPCRTKKGIFDE